MGRESCSSLVLEDKEYSNEDEDEDEDEDEEGLGVLARRRRRRSLHCFPRILHIC